LTVQGGATLEVSGGTYGQAIHAEGGKIIIQGQNTHVTAKNGTSLGVVRSGHTLSGYGGLGTVELNDGAKLTATRIDGTLIVNGKEGTLISGDNTAPSAYTVSGKVIDEANRPVANASVQLAPTGTAAIPAVMTDSNGKYTIKNVPAGSYTIQVSKVGYTSASTLQQVTVSGDLTAQDYTLTPIQYDVYVAGTRVTGANMKNVLNSTTGTTGTPTVVYTPAEGETPQTLTLNGVNITNTSSDTSATHHSGIEASDNLIIALEGDNNTISGNGHAINMKNDGTLTITGPGSLEASSNSGQTTVYTNGDVTINGGAKITATNTSTDLGDAFDLGTSNHNLTISDSDTEVIAQKTKGNQVAINHVATLTVNDGAKLTAQSNGTAISCDTLAFDD